MSSLARPRRHAEPLVRPQPARPDEYDLLVALAAQGAGPASFGANALATTLRHDPRFVAEHLRVIGLADAYAGLLLIDRLLRFGATTLRCAILAPFGAQEALDPASGAAALRDMLRFASAQGFQLAMLWAPQTGFEQGFGPGQKTYAVVLPAMSRPLGDTDYSVRVATAADASALAACYHAATATAMLAETRSDEPWQWRPADERQQIVVAVDPLGDVRGYARVVHDVAALHAPEIAIFDDGPAQALFDHLLRLAAGREVRVTATPENRWSRWAFAHGASLVVGPGDGCGAVRVLELRSLLQAVRPELERRLLQSEFVTRSGRLRLETPPGSVGLAVAGGRLALDDGRDAALVTLPWGALDALVTGYRDAESLAGQPGVRVEREQTLRLLQVLFPERHPHWSPPACF